jgi:hypothetical protein
MMCSNKRFPLLFIILSNELVGLDTIEVLSARMYVKNAHLKTMLRVYVIDKG